MIFKKVSLLSTILLIVFFGCDHTKSVLQPVDPIIPLSPGMSDTLMQHWRVTNIDGEAITESLSQLQTLISEHVSDEMNISFLSSDEMNISFQGIFANSNFQFNADGTWRLEVYYYLDCERIPVPDVVDPIANSSLVFITFLVDGTYIVGYDTEKQSNVLVFETDKHTEVHIDHVNPYSDFDITCIPEDPCDLNFYPAFTADLDWSIFEDEPLSKLFSSPLFDTEIDTPVVYTWDMVTSEVTPEDFYTEQEWWAGSSTFPEDITLIRRTIRLYFHGQEDIILRRTDEITD